MKTLLKSRALLAFGLVLTTGSAVTMRSQSAVDWYTIDATGGAHSSANYVVNFTAGQSDVGGAEQNSANYRIIPGYWALENLGPDTGLPELNIVLDGSDVVLSWPSTTPGFVLQHSDSFNALPASWSNTGGVASDNGFVKSVTIPHNLSKRFYRLERP